LVNYLISSLYALTSFLGVLCGRVKDPEIHETGEEFLTRLGIGV